MKQSRQFPPLYVLQPYNRMLKKKGSIWGGSDVAFEVFGKTTIEFKTRKRKSAWTSNDAPRSIFEFSFERLQTNGGTSLFKINDKLLSQTILSRFVSFK